MAFKKYPRIERLGHEDNRDIFRFQGDAILIKPNQKHRFIGLTDAEIIEFSTHHEEEDSYRTKGELSGEVDLEKL